MPRNRRNRGGSRRFPGKCVGVGPGPVCTHFFGRRKTFEQALAEAFSVDDELPPPVEHETVDQPVLCSQQMSKQLAFLIYPHVFGGEHRCDQLLVRQLRRTDLAPIIVALFQIVQKV